MNRMAVDDPEPDAGAEDEDGRNPGASGDAPDAAVWFGNGRLDWPAGGLHSRARRKPPLGMPGGGFPF